MIFLLRKSDIEAFGFSDIIFAILTREANITRRKPNITAKQYHSPQANITEKLQLVNKLEFFWRRHPDLNWRITVLQTVALPLGYVAVFGTRVLYHGAAVLSMDFEKLFLFGVVLLYVDRRSHVTSTACRCISSIPKELYIINTKCCISSSRRIYSHRPEINACGDDIHADT